MLRPLLQVTAAVSALALIPIASGAMAGVDTNSYRELDTFMEVFNRVKAELCREGRRQTLVKGAIQGMLAALDPHSLLSPTGSISTISRSRPTAITAASASSSRRKTARSR